MNWGDYEGEMFKINLWDWLHWLLFVWVAVALISCLFGCSTAHADTASWYTLESTLKEGNSGICADGKLMKDDDLICATWLFPLKTRLKCTNLENGKSVVITVRDRGPAKRLARKGRVIDLSRGAFLRIADLKKGIIPVKVEAI